jgi:hypothetical protein
MRDMLRSKLDQVEHELSNLGESNSVIRDGVTRGATKIGLFASKIGDLPGLPNVRQNVRRRMARSPTNDELLPPSPKLSPGPLVNCANSGGAAAAASPGDSCAPAAASVSSGPVRHTL